jgi:cation:H+ antiporter
LRKNHNFTYNPYAKTINPKSKTIEEDPLIKQNSKSEYNKLMELSFALFGLGAILLLISTQIFIKKAEKISKFLKLSPLVIGLTIVSIGTSLPELTVSTIAVLNRDAGFAMGNLIGSNIVNVFLVLGVGIFAGKLRVGTTKTQKNIFLMIGITALFLIMYFLQIQNKLAGLILISLTIVITISEYAWGVKGRNQEDAKMYKNTKKTNKFSTTDILILLASLIFVILGGILTVNSIEKLSILLSLSTTILGLSATAIATSLPELLTTIFSQKDNQEKLTIGNLIGSNIYNLGLIGGIVLVFSPWKIISTYEITMLIIATLTFLIITILNRGKIISKIFGFILLALFCLYIFFLR